ncbi:MAG: hypothetical protein Ta2B_13990 [Termitinemataceae bacterium]|nr:MAG: hypothetical protein Ta2B_13990 [Termitinemataceae bacterium]
MKQSITTRYEWDSINWHTLERAVFKIQKRIYQASKRNDTKKVHQLQRLLINSRNAKLLAVKRVLQVNKGRNTAGIDGVKTLTKERKLIKVRN